MLEILAEHAKELLGADRATISLTDTDESAPGSATLRRRVTDDTDRLVGVICLQRSSGTFKPEEDELLEQLCQIASVSVHNARVRDALRLSEERLRHALDSGRDQIRHAALHAEVGVALTTTTTTVVDMLQHCADAIVRHMDVSFVRIWTLASGSQLLQLQASAGRNAYVDGAHSRVPIGMTKIGVIARDRRPQVTNQLAGDPDFEDPDWAKTEGLVAFAGFPLVVSTQVVGVLATFAKWPISDEASQALDGVSRTVALGIERKQAGGARDLALAETAAERRRLEISNRELNQFAYVASHDLKAPLRGIANLAQWIEEDLQDVMREETRGMLALLRSRMHRMEALIEGILEFSRAGRLRGHPQTVNVGMLLGEVIELLDPPTGTTVVVKQGMPTMITDRLGLQQVFLNLIGNAFKYVRGTPGARVEVGVADGGGAFYEFFIGDNGPGIPIEFQERIWEIFQTLAPRDEIEGTGIGLSLVKKTVEARGGNVRVESAPGQGSTFSFLWPKRMSREDAA